MELQHIKELLTKYEEGATSIAEEKILKEYFSSNYVDSSLAFMKPMFTYIEQEKAARFTKNIPLQSSFKLNYKLVGIAALLVLGFGVFYVNNLDNKATDLGTFNNPDEAFVATKKALKLVSKEVNNGVEGVAVLGEYDKTRKTIFK